MRVRFLLACGVIALSGAAGGLPAHADGFSGPYIGVTAVYTAGDTDVTVSRAVPAISFSRGAEFEGGIFGLFGGIDWRVGHGLVLGVLGDVGWTKVGAEDSGATTVGTLRGRIGALAAPNVLLYGTGGLSFLSQTMAGSLAGASYSVSETRVGWTAGGGIELRRQWLDHGLRVGFEVLYHDLPALEFDVAGRHVSVDTTAWTYGLRVGIDFAKAPREVALK